MTTSRNKTLSLARTGRLWSILAILATAFAGALFITVSLYWFGTRLGIPLVDLSGDPSTITNHSVYIGVLSNLGVILWGAAAACAFLGAALQQRNTPKFWFLLASGLFSAVLALDDLLLFHDLILPKYLHIPERINYLAYFLLAGLYLLFFIREIIADTDYAILIVSLVFFGLSVIFTRIFRYNDLVGFIKDALKFFGIVFWLVYFANAVVRFVREDRGPVKPFEHKYSRGSKSDKR